MISHNWSPMKRLIWLRGSGITGGSGTYETISGNPVSFTAKAAPLRQLSVAFSPVQEGSGDPSPDNVRPILGWDSLNVWQDGVNLFDGEMENGDISETTGQNAGTSSSRYRSKNYIPVPDTTQFPSIYFHTPDRTGTVRLFNYDKDKNFLWISTADCNSVYTFSGAGISRVKYIRFRFASAKKDGDAQISLNIPTTVHEYVPYNGRSISITLGSTVYSGTVDVVTGQGDGDMGYVVYDGSDDEDWVIYNSSNYGGFRCNNALMQKGTRQTGMANWAINASIDKTKPSLWNGANSKQQFVIGVAGLLDNYDDSTPEAIAATLAQWRLYLAAHPLQTTFPLETSIPIQLTPEQVNSLAGDNTMWTDAQNLEVTYRSN